MSTGFIQCFLNNPSTVFNFTATVENGLNVYTKSTTGTTNLVTDSNGQFKLDNIPIGDYYLEETEAPSGFNNKESDGTTNRKVYFSVGENNMTTPKEVTMSDEMKPAFKIIFSHFYFTQLYDIINVLLYPIR